MKSTNTEGNTVKRLIQLTIFSSLLITALAQAQPRTDTVTQAEQYPDRTVRIIFPFPPGGISDLVSRLVGQNLSDHWSQPVVQEVRTGGAAIPATEYGAKAVPDGYSMLFVANSFAGNPALRKDLPYDTVKDFAPVTLLGSTPLVLTVNSSVPVNTVAELIAFAKQQPGKLSYGAAVGSSPHLAMAWFAAEADIEVVHVPYRGQAQVQTDLRAGHIHMVFGNLPDVLPASKLGELRILGIATAARSPLAPDIPTLAEAGYGGQEWDSWYGLVAPANTPKPIIDKVQAAVAKVLVKADVKERLFAAGLVPIGSTPEQFKTFLQEKMTSYAKVIKNSNIKPQ